VLAIIAVMLMIVVALSRLNDAASGEHNQSE
jgi:hypothetical protein